ncbi:MAG: carboxylesterase [Wenzhouxiangella sp.]|nr:MAG: carboxylesterase [Wenzhouxiangella sp.]
MNSIDPKRLECVVRETGTQPRHAVIWLHGLGADGNDFVPIVPHLTSAAERPVRFIFPHAPVRPVTVNGGMAMRAWYDILGLQIDRDQDRAGILASLEQVDALVAEQIEAGIPSSNLILAGFSQGGAIALRCGLARAPALAGIMVLSAYLLDADRLDDWAAPESNKVPIFIGHGSQDPVVPVALGQQSASQLTAAGYRVEMQTWPMPHSVCPEEISAIDDWLRRCWS